MTMTKQRVFEEVESLGVRMTQDYSGYFRLTPKFDTREEVACYTNDMYDVLEIAEHLSKMADAVKEMEAE